MRSRPPALALAVGMMAIAAGAASLGTDEPARPPPPRAVPSFAAALDLILVDAVVTDRQGRPVEGLTAADFVVREDGVPQTLTSFEAVALAPPDRGAAQPPTPATDSRSSANDAEASRPQRVFLLVVDDAGLDLDGAAAAQKAAMRFLSEAAGPGDLVSLVLPGAGLTWSTRLPGGMAQLASTIGSVTGRRGLSREFAGDWDALRVAESLDPQAQERVRSHLDAGGLLPREARLPGESSESYEARNRASQEPFVLADSRRQRDLARDRRRLLFGQLAAALDGVASIKGRKSVLLFSEGFIQEPNDPPFRDFVSALRRSNASIYFVNVRRLSSGAVASSRSTGELSAGPLGVDPQDYAGAEVVAEQTGGFSLLNPDDLGAGLSRVARDSSSYYLIGYSPANTKRDGKYRSLHVDVRRVGLEVRARTGYYSASRDEPSMRTPVKPGIDPVLEDALNGAAVHGAIPLRIAAFTLRPIGKGKVRVRIAAEIGLKTVRFDRRPDGSRVATLDVAIATNHVDAAGRLRTPWRQWRVEVPPGTEALPARMPVEGTFDLPGGPCQARVAVRDRGSRALGSVARDFDVPDPAAWRISTPILSDVPGEERGIPPPPAIGRSFVAGGQLYCYLEVYGGVRRDGSAASRATLAYTLVDASGKTRKSKAASPIDLLDRIPTRLEAIPLSGFSPGEYELRLSVRDEASGRSQELREPFVVRRPSRPNLGIYLELIQAFLAGQVTRASSGVMEWRPQELERLAASLPRDATLRRGALLLHTALAFRLWSSARTGEAMAQVAIGRALLAAQAPDDLHRDWLIALGYHQLAAGSPVTALPYFEECTRLFPAAAAAWLGRGICYELSAFPDGFTLAALPVLDPARQAERSFRAAAQLEPGLAEARLRLGRVLARAGELDEAESEFSAAVEASTDGPLTALARVFWGTVRDTRGDLVGAVSQYEAALAADGQCEMAAFALAEALYRRGDRRRAGQALSSTLGGPGATEVGPWHDYHVGSGRWKAYLPRPQEAGEPLAAAAQP